MKQRIFSFVVLWAVVLVVPWLLGAAGVAALVTLFAFLTQREIYQMLGLAGHPAAAKTGLLMGLVVSVAAFLGPRWDIDLSMVFGTAVAVVVISFLRENPEKRRFSSIGATVGGLTLGPFMLGFLTQILILPGGGIPLVLWVIGVTKFADVGGLLVGMAIGRHKVAPNLSPKKTWEGVIGGVCFSIVAAVAAVHFLPEWFAHELTPLAAGLIAVPLAISGICADLFESSLKREAKVKDSGKIFPGIGGAFDLTDSVVLSAPIAYLCLRPLIG